MIKCKTLLADTALYSNASTISTVVVSPNFASAQNASWTNVVGVSTSGNSLTKTGNDGWDAGAASTQSITSGDGYVEFTATETNKHRRIGVSNGDGNQSWDDIDFCFYLNADGNVYINEGSTSRGSFGTYSTGDVLKVAVEAGVVKYRKNGALLYTSTVTPTYPLLVDTSLYSNGSTISSVVLSSSSSATATINWLLTDQLGTPRMIFDQSGSLANVKRHDYLPFGEELSSVNGLRSSVVGFTGDAIRQKFTSKERDTETGLDYFGARNYSSTQGRFTSIDPITLTLERLRDPQRLNLYQYCKNSPLKYIDPDGEDLVLANAAARARVRQVLAPGLTAAERRNIRISGNRVQLRNPNISNPSPAYRYLSQIITNSNLTINYYAVAQGQTVTTASGITASYKEAVDAHGLTTGNVGDSVRDVLVPVGGSTPVAGAPAGSGKTTPMPEDVIFAHEAYGHGLNNDAVQVENEYRANRNPSLLSRSGEDHQSNISVTAGPELIQANPPVPVTEIQLRPIAPVPPPRAPRPPRESP